MSERFAVIMAGGRGERFWPASRLSRPKHLLPIVGDDPMLTQTVKRLDGIVPRENLFVITNREQREAMLEIVPGLVPEQVIAEPVGRDTAPAVALATVLVKSRNPEAAFAMLPADAVIHESENFQSDLMRAFEAAEREDAIVTIGVTPSYPATGYGYVHRGEAALHVDGSPVYSVRQFVEKPDLPTAEKYVASGDYLWNAGIFVWRVPVIESQFELHAERLWKTMGEVEKGMEKGVGLGPLLDTHYPSMERISIDFAVLEKASRVLTVEAGFDWDDVGEWAAIARHYEADKEGNVAKGTTLLEESSGNIVVGEEGHLLALFGVDDLIVVQTDEATLVCSRSRSQDIKNLVQKISGHPDWNRLC